MGDNKVQNPLLLRIRTLQWPNFRNAPIYLYRPLPFEKRTKRLVKIFYQCLYMHDTAWNFQNLSFHQCNMGSYALHGSQNPSKCHIAVGQQRFVPFRCTRGKCQTVHPFSIPLLSKLLHRCCHSYVIPPRDSAGFFVL